MIEACVRLMNSGIKLSTTIILGLGGTERWREHAISTADVLNEINPDYLGALTLMVVEGTELHREIEEGKFQVPDSGMILREMHLLVKNLDLCDCIFRSNHASNYLPIGGILSKDKDRILKVIDIAIKNEVFLRPESYRAL